MTATRKILVTGGTGGVGRHVVAGLVERGDRVCALVRDPEAADLPTSVDVVAGDLAEPETLDGALDGVDSVFLLWPFFSAAGAPVVVDKIARRAPHVVYLSAEGAAEYPESFWAAMEGEIQKSGASWTFLRPTGFAKNTLDWADQVREGVVRAPNGQAARSLIDERDIAAVAVRWSDMHVYGHVNRGRAHRSIGAHIPPMGHRPRRHLPRRGRNNASGGQQAGRWKCTMRKLTENMLETVAERAQARDVPQTEPVADMGT